MSRAPVLAIVVHGGAWSIPLAQREAHRRGCSAAAELGWRALEQGGSALDAVVEALRALEDDPTFDAGTGSGLAADRRGELAAGRAGRRALAGGRGGQGPQERPPRDPRRA